MVIFKCKMCGGDLEVNEKISVGTCKYCGSTMTLPKLDDDKRANLYDRANHFRRKNEFDKAMAIYESILNEDKTDAEAYWSLVLCKYGIEYVEDPKTKKRIPTCNRTQLTSIFADEDYKSAIAYADASAKLVYESEAKTIDEIQKGILQISSNEEPFDIFICYKESDDRSRRTPDSVLAQDMYYHLINEGFKVFFSRITLENKLGTAYEPYIFAALNSAKVMVLVGTKPEYFNSVWVKNEWSRYIELIKKDTKKTLITAYKDMNPYDLPEEFGTLQAQDMGKLGFMQDLVRGLNKILHDKPISSVALENRDIVTTNSIEPLIKRIFMFLEYGDFDSADEYCEKVLDNNPDEYRAYLGKLMAEKKAKYQENLANGNDPLERDSNYDKAIRFANDEQKNILISYNQSTIKKYEERIRLENLKGEMEVRGYTGFSIINPIVKVYSSDQYIGSIKKGETVTFDINQDCTVTFKSSIRSASVKARKGNMQVVQLSWDRKSGELLAHMIQETPFR